MSTYRICTNRSSQVSTTIPLQNSQPPWPRTSPPLPISSLSTLPTQRIRQTLPPSWPETRPTLSHHNVRKLPHGPAPFSRLFSIDLLLFQSAVSAQRSSSVQSQNQTPRRLPPIPGNSPTSSMHGMPEPRPYHEPARSQDS